MSIVRPTDFQKESESKKRKEIESDHEELESNQRKISKRVNYQFDLYFNYTIEESKRNANLSLHFSNLYYLQQNYLHAHLNYNTYLIHIQNFYKSLEKKETGKANVKKALIKDCFLPICYEEDCDVQNCIHSRVDI